MIGMKLGSLQTNSKQYDASSIFLMRGAFLHIHSIQFLTSEKLKMEDWMRAFFLG